MKRRRNNFLYSSKINLLSSLLFSSRFFISFWMKFKDNIITVDTLSLIFSTKSLVKIDVSCGCIL